MDSGTVQLQTSLRRKWSHDLALQASQARILELAGPKSRLVVSEAPPVAFHRRRLDCADSDPTTNFSTAGAAGEP